MKTLTGTSLFELFSSYLNGTASAPGELPAAYDSFAELLAELPQDEGMMHRLRRLNYTRIELEFMQQACNGITEGCRHVLYGVFVGKAMALLDAEIEILKEAFRHSGTMAGFKAEVTQERGRKQVAALTWTGTDSDLIELVAALMATGAIGSADGRKLTVADVIRVFEEAFHLKINALYTKRGKVFDRCTDSTPFIDSLRKNYIRMLDERLA